MKKFVLPFLLLTSPVLAGNYLTQEMETLRSDLGAEDPARRELTLRLADIYFDLSIKDDPENKSQQSDRERSLALYQEALKGADGSAPLQGENRLKVIFQCARLQDKLNFKNKAEALFLELHANQELPRNLKLEAALYLGELNEDKAQLKEATRYYKEAIALCTSVDTCNFAHYRLGWTYFKETKLDEAIAEINLSLWDAKHQLRDQVVNDLISFMAQRNTDGRRELKEVEEVIKKSKNEKLLHQLAESFFVAGNRLAGSHVLTHINKKNPSLLNEVRLLEESYGFRKWDDVDQYLNQLSRRQPNELPKLTEEREEALKIHRRLIVQLDAEVDTNVDKADYLKRAINTYLALYPNDEMKIKMQEGWLKVEKDVDVKIARLGVWVAENIRLNAPQKDITNLRRTRLSLAQRQNNSEVVIEESMALSKSADSVLDRREYDYVAAYELNKSGKKIEAEALFKKLVNEALEQGIADKWTVLSQNLLLDIFNSRKDLNSIIDSVQLWTSQPNFKDRPELKDEFASMKVIATQARFEKAVVAGESKESLEHFFENCRQGILVPQSCENAKVLAVKLKDQLKLVALLEMSKDEAALMNEYELMGRFSDAARLREKLVLKAKPTLSDFLKVALLYELDLNFKDRNRILMGMVTSFKGTPLEAKYEKLLYVTLMEAGMIETSALGLGWSLPYKLKIVQQLEKTSANPQNRKLLFSEKSYQGPIWSRVVLEELQKLDDAQRKVSFYGGNSRALFKKKVDMISRYENEVNAYLEGADSETRVYLLSMVQRTNKDFADQIMRTPIPAELDPEMVEQIKANLTELAGPYYMSAENYQKLTSDELESIEDKTLKDRVAANANVADARWASFIELKDEGHIKTAGLDYGSRNKDLERLLVEPGNMSALSSLENFYLNNKSERIASYFKERIQLLKN